jgi:DNA invertase Pin-like site-specific DNA recombinase
MDDMSNICFPAFYARPGDVIVVVGIDRLGRNAAEVTMTIRELG